MLLYLNFYWRFQSVLKNQIRVILKKLLIISNFFKNSLQMLQIQCQDSNFFLLILGISFHLAPNIIYKSFEVFNVFLKEDFKLVLRQKAQKLEFLLISLEVDLFSEKWGYKMCLIKASCFNSVEAVFTLLTKIITFYISFSITQVWGSSF